MSNSNAAETNLVLDEKRLDTLENLFQEISELEEGIQEENLDSTLINNLTKMGTADDVTEHTRPGSRKYLSRTEAENLLTHPLLNRVCAAHPEAASRKGWKIQLPDPEPEREQNLNAEIDHLEQTDAFCEAQFLANTHGGAAIVQLVDDGRPSDKPINFGNIRRVRGYRVLDRWKIRPLITGYEDPRFVEHYEIFLPEYLTQGIKQRFQDKVPARLQNNYLVHRSRILPFYGIRCTPDMLLEEDGWGPSLLSTLYDQYKLYKTSLQSSGALLKDFSLFVLKWDGLLNLMASQDVSEQEVFKKQLALFQKMASVFGGVFIDKEQQTLDFPSRNFNGIDDIGNMQRDAFIGESNVPHTILFGESPSGLGATGESEERSWGHSIQNYQITRWGRNIRKANRIIINARELNVVELKLLNFGIKYESIIQTTVEEEVQNRSTQSQIDRTYYDMGLPAKEILKARFAGSQYSFETSFNEKAFDKEQERQEQESSGGFGGFDFGSFSNEPEPAAEEQENTDSADRTKRIIHLNGLEIGINNEVGESRFKGAPPLPYAYGHVRGSYGDALDGMSIDVYLGNQLDSSKIFKIRQLIPETGEPDEDKFFIGFNDMTEPRKFFLKTLGRDRFGGISEATGELDKYKKKITNRTDAKNPRDLVDIITTSYREPAREIIGDWLDEIVDWMETKDSLEEISQSEAEIFNLLKGEDFETLIEESNIVADLAGREEAEKDDNRD